VQRLVELVELDQLLQRLLLGDVPVAGDDLRGIARRQVDDEKGDERDADQERDGEEEPAERVTEQRLVRRVALE
jgi:hypothetical protein